MRKKIISPDQAPENPEGEWLDIESLAEVEITSEDPSYSIESALIPGRGSGWKAATAGKQTIRLKFDTPQQLQRIFLQFEETDVERTQEYVLSWSGDGGKSFHEIVRQQWNFSPSGTTNETQTFDVNLPVVTTLELTIIPEISGGNARAALAQMRLA